MFDRCYINQENPREFEKELLDILYHTELYPNDEWSNELDLEWNINRSGSNSSRWIQLMIGDKTSGIRESCTIAVSCKNETFIQLFNPCFSKPSESDTLALEADIRNYGRFVIMISAVFPYLTRLMYGQFDTIYETILEIKIN